MIFNGKYEEIALIGNGGFSSIYKVRNIDNNNM
jgi:hypothetical protein